MKIYYCVRDLTQIHSCIYNMSLIKKLGYEVIPIIGSTTENLNFILSQNGIDVKYYSLSKKITHWKYFVRTNYNFFKNMKEGLKTFNNKEDVIIIGTADSALYSYPLYIKKHFAICLLEMHERQKKLQRFLKYVCNKADSVICCEVNRARYAQFTMNLKHRPFVISNKPYGMQFESIIEHASNSQSTAVIELIKGHKSILYQAWHIRFVDVITKLAEALSIVDKDIKFVVMGIVDPCVNTKEIESIYPNIIWAGHIPAPYHYEVTRSVDIGVAMYAENSLNNMFCAPNKTFEYSRFGKPMLCNNIPGLIETVGISRAGLCVNWSDAKEVASAIESLLLNYDEFSKNSTAFNENEDNLEVMRQILVETRSRITK